MPAPVAILGVFVADTTYRADRQPRIGETILGKSFVLGPGGKGSNQAVAAARAGADTRMLTRLGPDAFGDMAMAIWAEAGVTPEVIREAGSYTGAAFIFLEAATGNNAIIICPGAAAAISPADVEGWAGTISAARVFMTQLEQPIDAAVRALQIAPAVVLQPFTYTLLLWAVVVGWVGFGDLPDLWVLLGAGLVVGAGLFTAWRDHALRRAA